jgi:amidase
MTTGDPQSLDLPAHAIAEAVRAGRMAADLPTREHLRRIAASGARLGAFQHVRAEAALREAQAVARHPALSSLPLAGVPIAIKDNIPVAGEPMRVGSAATAATPSAADHEVVRRLRAAGAVVVGLTRVPELCIWPYTDGPLGTSRNPWDTAVPAAPPEAAPRRSPGASCRSRTATTASARSASPRRPAACWA